MNKTNEAVAADDFGGTYSIVEAEAGHGLIADDLLRIKALPGGNYQLVHIDRGRGNGWPLAEAKVDKSFGHALVGTARIAGHDHNFILVGSRSDGGRRKVKCWFWGSTTASAASMGGMQALTHQGSWVAED